jgi:alkylated DNA repair dioxygenase AlkB
MQQQDLSSLPDCDIRLFPDFLSDQEATALFAALMQETPWQQDDIRVFGKTYTQPRLTALYGERGKPYTYSGITMNPHPFTPLLEKLQARLRGYTDETFTTCLLNLYRDGKDSNGWHADNEKSLGPEPVIASVSLGEVRRFKLKHRDRKDLRTAIDLPHGSLLLMQGKTQQKWLHEIPKTRRQVGPRINLTFRRIY